MSSNIQTLLKWMPMKIVEFDDCFNDCRSLQKDCLSLIKIISEKLIVLKNFHRSDLNNSREKEYLDIKDFENIAKLTENINLKFLNLFKLLKVEKEHLAVMRKVGIFTNLLWKSKLQLCYIVHELITQITCFFVSYGTPWLVLTLRLSVCFNNLLVMDSKFNLPKNTNTVCRNTCPYMMFPLKKFSITRILQILAKKRAEMCSHKLIDCLLETYKMYETSDDDWSESSSMEIYLALTKHMSPTIDLESYKLKTKEKTETQEERSGNFTSLEELISYEETNVLNILNLTAQMAPNMLGSDCVKKSKSSGVSKVKSEALEKVLEYYEQILWAEVGNYLEHVILWWASSPLSARPPHSSQHLREWINQFVPTADIPAVIASALTSLADALGVHVTSTLWDSCFRQALVSSKNRRNADTGQLFCNVLHELVQLSNLCEVTPDWVIGAPLDELPLVEQIPVLHRLDHSVHTVRLWAINECRKMAHNWDVHGFFSITQVDVVNSLSQLNLLRLNDHTVEIEKGRLAVHVEVCSLMRAKLVSEVRVNILKLKEAPKECIECLASICRTISLANLKMIFPPKQFWKMHVGAAELPEVTCGYVEKYLDQNLTPVLKATSDHVICNMILTLICESWLDHIYNNKIKFSQYGAYQLLTDFAFVTIWIQDCGIINEGLKKKLLKNEVLKRCEGVGKLLLRSPGERLKMVEKTYRRKSVPENSSGDEDSKEHMPAEMYVPNQEQWLELRALRKKALFNPLCC